MQKLAVAVLVLALVVPMQGANLPNTQAFAKFYHYGKRVEIIDRGGTRTRTYYLTSDDRRVPLELESAETLAISVEDPNPLVFAYSYEKGTPTPNPNYTEIEKAVEGLRPFVALLPQVEPKEELGLLRTPDEEVLVRAGFDDKFFDGFVSRVRKLDERVKSIPDKVKESAVSFSDASTVKRDVLEWRKDVRALHADLKIIAAADDALLAWYQPGTPAAPPQKDKEFEDPGKSKENTAKTEEKAKSEKTPSTDAKDADLTDAGSSGTAGDLVVVGNSTPTGTNGTGLRSKFEFAARRAPKVETVLQTLTKFIDTASEIGTSKELGRVAFNAKQIEHPAIHVKAAEKQEEHAKKQLLGDVTLDVAPYERIRYEFGPAVVYSFVEQEDWTTEPTAAGKHKVVRASDDEVNGMTLSAMLSAIPKRWSTAEFTPAFEVGFSPVKDRMGIFAGMSFRLFDLVRLSGGIAYQQAERLHESQHEDQELDTADALRTELKPDTSFYFGLTIPVGKKK